MILTKLIQFLHQIHLPRFSFPLLPALLYLLLFIESNESNEDVHVGVKEVDSRMYMWKKLGTARWLLRNAIGIT
jgi:hypothetical protein